MIVVLAMVDYVVIIVIIIVVVVATKSGIGFFAKFKVSTNVGKIRVMLDRERSGR